MTGMERNIPTSFARNKLRASLQSTRQSRRDAMAHRPHRLRCPHQLRLALLLRPKNLQRASWRRGARDRFLRTTSPLRTLSSRPPARLATASSNPARPPSKCHVCSSTPLRNSHNGVIYLKVVNPQSGVPACPHPNRGRCQNFHEGQRHRPQSRQARMTLTRSMNPPKLSLVTEKATGLATNFTRDFPPYSIPPFSNSRRSKLRLSALLRRPSSDLATIATSAFHIPSITSPLRFPSRSVFTTHPLKSPYSLPQNVRHTANYIRGRATRRRVGRRVAQGNQPRHRRPGTSGRAPAGRFARQRPLPCWKACLASRKRSPSAPSPRPFKRSFIAFNSRRTCCPPTSPAP